VSDAKSLSPVFHRRIPEMLILESRAAGRPMVDVSRPITVIRADVLSSVGR